jgi:hypothetical protein
MITTGIPEYNNINECLFSEAKWRGSNLKKQCVSLLPKAAFTIQMRKGEYTVHARSRSSSFHMPRSRCNLSF